MKKEEIIKEPTVLQCIARYIIKFKIIFISISAIYIICTIVGCIDTNQISVICKILSEITGTILLGIIASLIVQSFNDYYTFKEIRYLYTGISLDKLKDMTIDSEDKYEDKVRCISYVHDAIAEISNIYFRFYIRVKIDRSTNSNDLNTKIMHSILIMENYTRLNKNAVHLYNIDEIYNDIFRLFSKDEGTYWNYSLKLIEQSLITGKIFTRDNAIIQKMNKQYELCEYTKYERFMQQFINEIRYKKKTK